jgi:tetraacyldisaccharide 4'-kinase
VKRPWALPLVPLYAAGSALRWAVRDWMGNQPQRLAWPVVSVGSLSAGGAGKTPVVIALAKAAMELGRPVDVLSRGYGRVRGAAVQVDPAGSADVFGDEPLLIAREAGVPVYVGARRWDAGRLTESAGGYRVHLLDDGFQHRQLYRDVDIVLVSSADLEDWLLPAGNRREPLGALRRATVFAVTEEDEAAVERLRRMNLMQPVWRYRREMVVPAVSGPVVAFCGIARPEQFWKGLEEGGIEIAARKAFPDHHGFSTADLTELRRLAVSCGADGFVTTAKDAVRLGEYQDQLGLAVAIADVRVSFSEKDGPVEGLWGWRGLLT